MNSADRFNNALNALYLGFYNSALHPEDACKCAVGTICNGWDAWKNFSDHHGSTALNYTGQVHQRLGRSYYGYSPKDLLFIEAEFLSGCGYTLPLNYKANRPDNPEDPEVIFNGLCAAVNALCTLEGVHNVMDYTQVFLNEVQRKRLETA